MWRQCLLLASVLLLSACHAQDVGQELKERRINTCVLDKVPFASCDGLDPTDFTGFDIAVLNRVADKLGGGFSFNMSCYNEVEEIYTAAAVGQCDIMLGGIPASTDPKALQYVTYSWPIHRSGFRIVVPTGKETVNYWAFLKAFEWEVWVAMGLTILFVGVFVFVLERWEFMGGGKYDEDDPPMNLQEQTFATAGLSMTATEVTSKSFAPSLVLVTFSFLCMIMLNLYTANSAADLTATRLSFKVTGLKDLPGRRVATYQGSEEGLKKYGINAIGINPLTGPIHEIYEASFKALLRGEYDALILDATFMEYLTATHCDIALVGEEFLPIDTVFAVPRSVDQAFLDAFNMAIVSMYPSGEIEKLESEYLSPPEASCKSAVTSEESTQIKFKQVAGLWILLAGAVAVSLILVLVHKLVRRGAKKLAKTDKFQAGVSKLRSGAGRLGGLASSGHRAGSEDGDLASQSDVDEKGLNETPPSERNAALDGDAQAEVLRRQCQQAMEAYHSHMERLLQSKV